MLVFILILLIFIILISMITLSTVKFSIENVYLSNVKKFKIKNKDRKNKAILKISLYLFDKIKWISIRIKEKRQKELLSEIKNKKINIKELIKNTNIEILDKLNIKISNLKLNVKIGTEDIFFTSFVVYAVSTIIAIILPGMTKENSKKNIYYEVLPLYESKNLYDIDLNCIIELKMVHIIGIIYILIKKRRDDKNDKRASNRRSYGYSYE